MTEIDVDCEIYGNTLKFKCPFCKNLTKKGTVRKKNGDVYHTHGLTPDNPTYRTPHCFRNKKDFTFVLHY